MPFRLVELHRHFGALYQLDRLALTIRVAGGEARPGTVAELHRRQGGLQAIANLYECGRSRSPAHLAAAIR
jgi:hypothetical protein